MLSVLEEWILLMQVVSVPEVTLLLVFLSLDVWLLVMQALSVPEVTFLLVFAVLVARHLLSWYGLAVDMGVATSQSNNLLRRRSVAEWLKKLR